MTIGTLPTGTDAITATYSGDSNNASSTSPALSQVVNKDATATSLTASPNPSVCGGTVNLTATITPKSGTGVTGTVTFSGGGSVIGSGFVKFNSQTNTYVATMSAVMLPAGKTSMTAAYSGDNNFGGSTSSAVSEVVNKEATFTSLASSSTSSTYGQSVTFVATITHKTEQVSGELSLF